ncbi:hypothetical protein EYF80_061814 [Liparis tanakae]|uniref:Uncharacterized protein n=1 Tax=Liparis tanakae TaxID=230148 RepID=A0A4Z2EGZ4_9TELE|nr:hypothetical protein EYF80_061814 [Liparis tanakae]
MFHTHTHTHTHSHTIFPIASVTSIIIKWCLIASRHLNPLRTNSARHPDSRCHRTLLGDELWGRAPSPFPFYCLVLHRLKRPSVNWGPDKRHIRPANCLVNKHGPRGSGRRRRDPPIPVNADAAAAATGHRQTRTHGIFGKKQDKKKFDGLMRSASTLPVRSRLDHAAICGRQRTKGGILTSQMAITASVEEHNAPAVTSLFCISVRDDLNTV